MDSSTGPNRIQVVVRVRPVMPNEIADEVAVTCSPDASKLQVLLPERLAGTQVLPGASKTGARSYEFDACLSGSTTQEELFDVCGLQELVDSALDGYCVTIFAFGQTGSGKTHTVIGPRLSRGAGAAFAGGAGVDPEDGLLTRCIDAAYRGIEAREEVAEYEVSASVVELYNETVTDLLALDKNKTLQVRKDARDGFQVVGLTQVACPSDAAACQYMTKALQHRHTRGHKLNEYSSRSHCMLTFVFASKERGTNAQRGSKGGIRRFGKLCLVDLAGSERLKETGNTSKEAVRETGAINKSLFVLGQVLGGLSAKSTGASRNPIVPYRESKLTQLLWDGLRGTGRCLMLACLGPMRSAADETLNTLHFATMALRIKAEPIVLLDPQDQLVLELRKTITDLRSENRQLADALKQLSSGVDASSVLSNLSDELRQDAISLGAGSTSGAFDGTDGSPRSSYGGQVANGAGGSSINGPESSSSPKAHRRANTLADGSGAGSSRQRAAASGESSVVSSVSSSQAQAPGRAGTFPAAGGNATRGGSGAQAARYLNGGPSPKAANASPGRSRSRSRSVGAEPRQSAAASPKVVKPAPPSLYQEDPAALLFGLSPSLQPPTPTRAGAGGDALPPLPSSGGAGRRQDAAGASAPAPMAAFPELAALEAEFQAMMAGGGGGPRQDGSQQQRNGASGNSGRFNAARVSAQPPQAAAAGEAEADDGGPKADVQALRWAERNTWFGTDYDMTVYAYQVHDRLVDGERVDPSSDLYYMEIDRRVAEKFPEKWAAILRQQQQQASAAASASSSRKASASPGRGSTPPPATHFGAGLRVAVKEPLANGSGGSGASAPSTPPGGSGGGGAGYGGGMGASMEQWGSNGSAPATPLEGSAVNPFNIQALHSAAPPKASRFAPPGSAGSAAGGGMVLMPMGSFGSAGGARRPGEELRFAAAPSGEDPQQAYIRQRNALMAELRVAKDEAEAERKRILAKINRAVGRNKWQ